MPTDSDTALLWYLDKNTLTFKRKGQPDLGTDPTTPPPDPTYVRPTGASYVTYESQKVGTEDLQHTFARVAAGKVVTFGTGTYQVSDFKYGGLAGMRVGNAAASLPVAQGMAGSGSGFSGGAETIMGMVPNSNTKTQATLEAAGTNQGYIFYWYKIAVVEIAGIHFKWTDQSNAGATSAYWNGLGIANSNDAGTSSVWVHDCWFDGFGPGYGSVPPPETFMLQSNHSDNYRVDDCIFDGTTVAASLVGMNNSTNIKFSRCTFKNSPHAAGLAMYQCNTLHLVDCDWSATHSPQLNLERQGQTGQVVNIVRPQFSTIAGSSTTHIAVGNDQGWSRIYIINPDLSQIPSGKINVRLYTTYAGNATKQTLTAHGLGVDIFCITGAVWDDVTNTFSGGTSHPELLNVTT